MIDIKVWPFVLFVVVVILALLGLAAWQGYRHAYSLAYSNGVIAGRIDIASGRVKATQVVNADGLTEWKFEEASK